MLGAREGHALLRNCLEELELEGSHKGTARVAAACVQDAADAMDVSMLASGHSAKCLPASTASASSDPTVGAGPNQTAQRDRHERLLSHSFADQLSWEHRDKNPEIQKDCFHAMVARKVPKAEMMSSAKCLQAIVDEKH